MIYKSPLLRIVIGGLAGNILLFAVGILFYLLMIQPLHTSLLMTKELLWNLEKKEVSALTASQEIEQRREDFTRLDNAFVNTKEIVSFVTLLETMARRHHVSLSIKSAALNTEGEASKQGSFEITTAGSFAQIMAFLTAAENMPYFTDITQFSITNSPMYQLQAELQIRVLTL